MAVAPVRAVARGADREPGRRLRAGSQPPGSAAPVPAGWPTGYRRPIPARYPEAYSTRPDRVPRRPAGQARRSITPAPRQAHSSAPGTWHPARWAGLHGVVRPHAAQVPARTRIQRGTASPGAGRPGGSPTLSASARTGRSADRTPDRGAGRPAVRGLAMPSRCCARSPQAAALLIARRQETQAGGADLGQLRPHLGLQPRACPKVPCVRPSEPFGGWYGAYGSAVPRALRALCGLGIPNTCRNQVPGLSTAYICAGQQTIECGQPGRLQGGRFTRSLPNRITTFHPIGPGRRPAHGWRRMSLPLEVTACSSSQFGSRSFSYGGSPPTAT
jgi:hypothetical protein